MLEGDDYWVDPHKLTKAVQMMEAHPEFTGCFHACEVISTLEGRNERSIRPLTFPAGPVRLQDMFDGNLVQTYSVVMYRRGVVTRFPDWHRSLACGDWALHMLHAEHGPFGFLPDVMAVYRLHPGGLMSSLSTVRRWQEFFTIWWEIDRHFQGRWSTQITAARNRFIERIGSEYPTLKRIERRYHLLQLDHVAAALRWVKSLVQSKSASP
jgi:hypothetical protein